MIALRLPFGLAAAMPGRERGESATSLSSSDNDGISDETLAERVRAKGDTEAFTLLMMRYRARTIALARQMLATRRSGPDEAEDVVQEAFVAAYAKRATFRRGERFRPWLYRIVVNRCLDRLRADARRPAASGWDDLTAAEEPESSAQADGSGGDPLSVLLGGERTARMEAAVAALAPRYRAVFLLRHLDDLSYEEIAEATDLPLGTVKTHLFRARAQLRTALKGYLDEEEEGMTPL